MVNLWKVGCRHAFVVSFVGVFLPFTYKLLVFAYLGLSQVSFAKGLANLYVFPEKKQFNVEFSMFYDNEEKLFKSNSTNNMKNESKTTLAQKTLIEMGAFNSTSIGLGISQVLREEGTIKSLGGFKTGNVNYQSSGMQDPVLSLGYQFIKKPSRHSYIKVFYSPKFTNGEYDESSGRTKVTSPGRGGRQFSLQVAREHQNNDWSFGQNLFLEFSGKYTENNVSNFGLNENIKRKTNKAPSFLFSLSSQYRTPLVGEKLFLKNSLGLKRYGKEKLYFVDSTGKQFDEIIIGGHFGYFVNMGLKYQGLKNLMSISLEAQYTRRGKYQSWFENNGLAQRNYDKTSKLSWVSALNFLF